MRADDGQMYVTVISVVNNTAELDIDRVVELMVALRDETLALGAD